MRALSLVHIIPVFFYYYYYFFSAWYTPVVGLSCSLVIYFWSCALAYYSARWLTDACTFTNRPFVEYGHMTMSIIKIDRFQKWIPWVSARWTASGRLSRAARKTSGTQGKKWKENDEISKVAIPSSKLAASLISSWCFHFWQPFCITT